jgi:hypothetical protein
MQLEQLKIIQEKYFFIKRVSQILIWHLLTGQDFQVVKPTALYCTLYSVQCSYRY